jgi:hypothetical protein
MEEQEPISVLLFKLSETCGMNQRYAQYMLGGAEWWNSAIDIAVVCATMFCLALTVAAYFVPEKHWWGLSFGLCEVISSFTAAVAGIVLIVSPTSASVRHYGSMFQAWSDLRIDVDSSLVDSKAADSPVADTVYLQRRYRDLLARKNALNAKEPSANERLLMEFLVREEISRGTTDESAAKEFERWSATSWVAFVSTPMAIVAILVATILWRRKNPASPATTSQPKAASLHAS